MCPSFFLFPQRHCPPYLKQNTRCLCVARRHVQKFEFACCAWLFFWGLSEVFLMHHVELHWKRALLQIHIYPCTEDLYALSNPYANGLLSRRRMGGVGTILAAQFRSILVLFGFELHPIRETVRSKGGCIRFIAFSHSPIFPPFRACYIIVESWGKGGGESMSECGESFGKHVAYSISGFSFYFPFPNFIGTIQSRPLFCLDFIRSEALMNCENTESEAQNGKMFSVFVKLIRLLTLCDRMLPFLSIASLE